MSEITTALLVAIRIGLPGWLWTMRGIDPQEPARTAATVLSRVGRAIALGLVLNLLFALCVAQTGHWTPRVDWCIWIGVVLAGLVRQRRLLFLRGTWMDAVCVMAFLAVVTTVVMWRAPRSEWFAGGWDPGLYQNSAVVVSRDDGFTERTDSVYAALTGEERSLIGSEAFPAVPISAETGAIQHYFFQLTPLCGALFYRWGGLDLLCRMNEVLAFMGLPVVFALAGVLGLTGWRRGWLLVAWCVSPLWWYQQAIPTTEILQLLLLCGAAVFYVDAERRGDRVPLGAALLLAMVVINHFGFPPLVAMVLVVAAAAESFAQRPGRSGRLLTCAVALAVGLAWDLLFSSATIVHLEVKDRVIPLVLIPFAVCAVAAVGVSRREFHPRLATWGGALIRWGALAAGILVVALTALLAFPFTEAIVIRHAARIPFAGDWVFRFNRFLPFHGAIWFLLLGVGTICLARDTTRETSRLRVLAIALAGVVLLLLMNPGVAPIYPWAFRRYIVFLLPLMTLVLGYGITLPALQWRRFPRLGSAMTLLLVAVLFAVGVRGSRRAARVGDYVGFLGAVATLNQSIQAGDIVVADDPRAGTPLLLMYGRDVLDGSGLWKSRDPECQRKYLAMLRRLQVGLGRRIVWLTSTPDAMELYPPSVGPVTPLTKPLNAAYRTVIHSPNADEFATRENESRFQLHVWQAPDRVAE